MNWSHFQRDIYQAFERGDESLLIEAVAGSGKTTVLVELSRIMRRAMAERRGVFLAFNKSIAMELQRRIDEDATAGQCANVQAMTLHGAGWAAWRRAGGLDWEPKVNSGKVSGIMRAVLSYEENKRFGETTRKLVAAAKGIGLVPKADFMEFAFKRGVPEYRGLVQDWDDAWMDLIEHYGLDEGDCNIDIARRVLAESIRIAKESVDFDDMLYMPVVAGVPFDRYDVVLVDEAQDLSGIQHEIISRMVIPPEASGICGCGDSVENHGSPMDVGHSAVEQFYPGGRIIAVGDRHQAIYSWRGAHQDSMDRLKRRFQMRELPLSVSYRCPVAVVQHARQWVPQIEWRDSAEDGVVFPEGTDWQGQCDIARDGISKWRGLHDFQPGDAVLCRLTRPLVAAAFTLIRNRIAGVHVLGRDIGKGLVDIVKKAKSLQAATIEEFDRWLEDYEHRESTRLGNRGKHAQAGLLGDKCDTIRVFMEHLGEGERVPRLIAEVERLFVDANGEQARMITLSTVHKAKGGQWPRVFILDAGETMPCRWARAGWEMDQEANIAYVAATRAMHELRYITTGDLRGEDEYARGQ